MLDDQAELLIGSIIADKVLQHYKKAKEDGNLETLPVISIVIEETPRVLSEEVLRSHGNNIYSDIASEGRKVQDWSYCCYSVNKRYSEDDTSKYEY